jgi:hypothetical protein
MDEDRVLELKAIFADPDGVIDDAEELLNEIPDWLDEIVALRAKVKRLEKRLELCK